MPEILIFIALAGSLAAGLWDLKTTEVPDEIPALMIALSIFILYIKAAAGDIENLALSLIIGTILLAAGLALYKKGQWGAADAWILAAIGYAIPTYNGRIFIIDFIFNFLIVSAVYMILYTLVLGIMNRALFFHFLTELRKRARVVISIIALFSVLFYALSSLSPANPPILLPILIVAFLSLFWVYAKAVEKYAFRKRIPASRLKPGDVLEDMIWRGLTEEEVIEMRKKKRYVVVKEGVRFVMVFPITLAVTLAYGNLFLILFG